MQTLVYFLVGYACGYLFSLVLTTLLMLFVFRTEESD